MNNLPKYILVFLATIYSISCVAEVCLVKNGTEAVFESVKAVVPHLAMFVLGTMFSRR